MDDGLDHNHPDLKRNFDWNASWDANGKRELKEADPEPRKGDDTQNHGTKCAGEIAMQAGNENCGVGVAPDCKIGGIRVLDGPITDKLEARAILFKNEYVDIYSASWGPKDNGETMEAPGKGGSRGDDCGADGYVGSIYTISIGSINENGESTYFMEKCPSSMAVVFSGGMHDRHLGKYGRVKTISTDINGE